MRHVNLENSTMNFTSFTGHLPSAVPTVQFATKFGYEGGSQERYQGGVEYQEGGKFRQENVVVSVNNAAVVSMPQLVPSNAGGAVSTVKYHTVTSSSGALQYAQAPYQPSDHHEQLMKQEGKREYRDEQDLINSIMQQQASQTALSVGQAVTTGVTVGGGQPQQLVVVLHEATEDGLRPIKRERLPGQSTEFISAVPASGWTGAAVADYLSSLPLGLHHLLKYSADGKREDTPLIVTNPINANISTNVGGVVVQTGTLVNQSASALPAKKKKKKRPSKEKKPRPRPGEIRLTTALDGSTLYCCPECHMAYPERGLLEQHMAGHIMERKFICEICNAALKRKDHLTRHKQSHNPERPYVCTVCLKAFKRKEQLTLHFVIHSGEKRHVCQECGKGFYRKDHLRKHARSHIARRVKAEMSQQSDGGGGTLAHAVPAPPL